MKKKTALLLTLLLLGSMLAGILPISGVAEARAAQYDQSFINEVSSRYSELEKKYQDYYREDLKHFTQMYDQFYDLIHDQQSKLERLGRDDLNYLSDLLSADAQSLSETYKDSSSRDALTDYKRQSNPNYSSGAMWKYATALNKNYSSSLHWSFATQINANYSSSIMWRARNDINPNYSGSIMWSSRNETNPDYSGSKMSKLRNESNPHYSGSIMSRYRLGSLSKAEAEKQINQVLQAGEEDLGKFRSKTVDLLEQSRVESEQKLIELRNTTVKKLLQQRSHTLEDIMSIRKRHFGGELEIKPFHLSFDEIQVVIDGELQTFEQPPVNKDGSVLVPMRAIFERLGAEIKWNDAEKAVTATKNDIAIYIAINSKSPTINGVVKELEVPAQLVNGYTMVPVRFISEALNAEVSWEQQTQTVFIQTK
ncbi:stalk domain-containing protein [Paenibacillus puerhi]|uniref:stalk domain-containing protein n=1 Tax=Paenibacillus puerhi TaxID=2692622 RepID=UPI001358A709|nr:stalk domain-containing protein [Paenibacillus puerhi]